MPIVFSKVPESVIATGEPILMDANVSTTIDYEVELAVIIGREGRGIKKADALSYVWGYTIINDVTARDLPGASLPMAHREIAGYILSDRAVRGDD